MKILVIGAAGNMGRRYCAILKYLAIYHVGVDIGNDWPADFDKAIVCTPTDTHYDICVRLIGMGKPFLCEKPVSKDLRQVEDLERLCKEQGVDGYMVNNWSLVMPIIPTIGKVPIYYNFYNTGKDGFAWDLIQLIYMCNLQSIFNSNAPMFIARFGEYTITIDMINISYITMIANWVTDHKENLWTMTDAVAATKKVIEYEKTHKI